MTNYRRGYAHECAVRNHYRRHGWDVSRSAASKTVVDLWCVPSKGPGIHLVQCKRDGKLPVEEWNRLFDWACRVGLDVATAVLAEWLVQSGQKRRVRLWHLTGEARGTDRPCVPFDL